MVNGGFGGGVLERLLLSGEARLLISLSCSVLIGKALSGFKVSIFHF